MAARPICASVDCDYYTDAITYTKVTILDTFESGPGTGIRIPSHRELGPSRSRIPNPESRKR